MPHICVLKIISCLWSVVFIHLKFIWREELCAGNSPTGTIYNQHDDIIKWKHVPRYKAFVRGIHRSIPLTKASDAELWCFLWSATWIKGWVTHREADALRRHRAHYDVIVMVILQMKCTANTARIFIIYPHVISISTNSTARLSVGARKRIRLRK